MSTPFADLSGENHDQIRKYLSFFRNKKDGIVRTAHREIMDVRDDRLNQDMYTRDDVEELFEVISSAMKSSMSHEVSTVINMGALAIDQLLYNAQKSGVDLTLDTASLEDQGLVEAVNKMSLDAAPKNVVRNTKLASFRDEAKGQKDQMDRLEESKSRLEDENASLRGRLQKAESNNTSLRSKSDAKQSAGIDSSSRSAGTIADLERALEEAKRECELRVSETTQFKQMQKEMRNQNLKIRDLRSRLTQYEPESLKEQDDDD